MRFRDLTSRSCRCVTPEKSQSKTRPFRRTADTQVSLWIEDRRWPRRSRPASRRIWNISGEAVSKQLIDTRIKVFIYRCDGTGETAFELQPRRWMPLNEVVVPTSLTDVTMLGPHRSPSMSSNFASCCVGSLLLKSPHPILLLTDGRLLSAQSWK